MPHAFVDSDGVVLLSLEQRGHDHVAFVGTSDLFGRRIQMFVPLPGTEGAVARVVVGARVAVCRSRAGIDVARRALVSMHNHSRARVLLLHGYLVASLTLKRPRI